MNMAFSLWISILFTILVLELSEFEAVAANSEMSFLKDKIMNMEKILTRQQSHITDLEGKIRIQDKEIQNLKSEILFLKPEVKATTKTLNFLKKNVLTRILMQPEAVEEVKQERSSSRVHNIIPSEVDIQENRLLNGREANPPVAFYVYLSYDVHNPAQGQTLIFDVVKTNTYNNAYNKFSGIFSVPMSGMYVFTSSIAMNGVQEYASYEIMRNSNVEGTFFVDAEYTDGYKYSSITVVVEVEQGDVVFVRTGTSYKTHGSVYSRQHARSTFAGWRIQ